MAQKEGRPDCWWIGHVFFFRNFRKSRSNRWEVAVPSFWALIEAEDCLFTAVLTDLVSSGLGVLTLKAIDPGSIHKDGKLGDGECAK